MLTRFRTIRACGNESVQFSDFFPMRERPCVRTPNSVWLARRPPNGISAPQKRESGADHHSIRSSSSCSSWWNAGEMSPPGCRGLRRTSPPQTSQSSASAPHFASPGHDSLPVTLSEACHHHPFGESMSARSVRAQAARQVAFDPSLRVAPQRTPL